MSGANRREFVAALAGAAVGMAAPRRAAAETDPVVERLAPDLAVLRLGGRNVVALARPEGLLLVNGGAPNAGAALSALLEREFPGAAVKMLVDTDWHPENVGFNALAATGGATIVAHENTRLWLGVRITCRWRRQRFDPMPKAARPTRSFRTKETLTFGGEPIVLGHLGQAHTDGDCYVHLPGRDVLIVGDAVGVGRYPVMDYTTGGWIGGLVTASRTLAGVAGDGTRIIAGEGAVQARPHIAAQLAMLTAVRDRSVKMLRSGLSGAEMIAAAPTREFDAVWGSPELFMRNLYPGLWAHVRDLGGII